ncbi:MAG: chemotaxis protein CheW [Gammaproteobacteria bacterium]|nr:chemotaxis protein CheW [Gammaproteobacteria bacterium]
MTVLEKQAVGQLLAQDLALKVYIDALLDDVTEVAITSIPALQVVESQMVPVASSQVVVGQKSETNAVEVELTYPAWADSQFDCVLYKVAGALTLAVPLIELNGIVRWNNQVTALPGRQDWFLGLMPVRGRQVKVIDVARLVIPERHRAREALAQSRPFTHIILVGNGEWGLACESMGKVLKLTRDKIRWRRDRSQRPWLAGMLIDQMCALLDVERLIGLVSPGTTKETRRGDDI